MTEPIVKRLDHVNIRTWGLDATASFYEAALGLERGPTGTLDPDRNAWMYDAGGRAVVHINMPAPGEAEAAEGSTGRLNHIAFECADFEAVVRRLAAAGIDHQTRAALRGLRQIFLFDPNGIRIELNFPAVARPDSADADR